MKNKKIVLVLFVLFSFNCVGKNTLDNSTIESLIKNHINKHRLVAFRTGNFTNSGNTEVLAYYNYSSISPKNEDTYDVASVLYVFIIKNDKIQKEYKCEKGNVGEYSCDKDNTIITNKEIINNKKLKFGKWDGYTFVYDYNENGLDEILLLQNGPEYFLPYIFEFHDGKMKTVLNVEDEDDFDANIKSFIETTSDKKGKYIEIYDEFQSNRKEKRYWKKYQWDKKKKRYVFVEGKRKQYVP